MAPIKPLKKLTSSKTPIFMIKKTKKSFIEKLPNSNPTNSLYPTKILKERQQNILKSTRERQLSLKELQRGNIRNAMELAKKIPLWETRSNTYAEIVNYMIKNGRLELASRTVNSISSWNGESKAVMEMVLNFAKRGYLKEARTIANKSYEYHGVNLYIEISKISRDKRDIARAIKLTKALDPRYTFTEFAKAHINIVEGMLNLGLYKDAIKLSNKIPDIPNYRLYAHSTIIKNLAANGRLDLARKLIQSNVSDRYSRSLAYIEIAKHSKNITDFNMAKMLADKIPDADFRELSNIRIVEGLTEVGHFELAKEFARKFDDVLGMREAYAGIARVLAEKGYVDRAIKLSKELDEPSRLVILDEIRNATGISLEQLRKL